MNLQDIRIQVSTLAGVMNAGSDQAMIDQYANEAVREILLRLVPYVKTSVMSLIADQGDYELPASILRIKAMELWDRTLEQVGPFEISKMRKRYPDATSPTRQYALNGSNMLMVYPVPDSADEITVYYVPRPTVMSTGTHDPAVTTYGGIPEEYHPLIVSYAASRLADIVNPGLADRLMLRYEAGLVQAKRTQNLKGSRNLAPARPGRSRRSLPADPSADIY